MNVNEPRALVHIFRDVVQTVSDKILPKLKANNPDITCNDINYRYGSMLEVVNTLTAWSKDPVQSKQKFPMVVLIEDFPVDSLSGSDYKKAVVQLLICTSTRPDYDSFTRQVINYDPILQPIYAALLDGLMTNPYIVASNRLKDLPHRRWDMKSLGRAKLMGSTFDDYVDAIQISNLHLKLNKNVN